MSLSNYSYRIEQRQHIGLSQYAYNIITSDSTTFWGKDNLSGFINRVFLNYYQDSKASISLQAKKYREHLLSLLQKRKGSLLIDNKVLNVLMDDYCNEIRENLSSFKKEVTKKIRLNNDVYDFLHPDESDNWPEKSYYKNRGEYIKAVLEDYARLSFFERERVFFKEFIDIIENELDHQEGKTRILQIVYSSRMDNVLTFNVKPFSVQSDKDGNYNYLVGYSCNANKESRYVPGSFRISRIISIKPHGKSFGSGKITKEQENILKREIEDRGVQYLFAKQEDIVVKLTAEGKRFFNNSLLQRPLPITEKTKVFSDGSVELHFSTTRGQINNYFFKFGKEAKIISPKNLAESFCSEYNAAFERYQADN